jgi:hypothetical protein
MAGVIDVMVGDMAVTDGDVVNGSTSFFFNLDDLEFNFNAFFIKWYIY